MKWLAAGLAVAVVTFGIWSVIADKQWAVLAAWGFLMLVAIVVGMILNERRRVDEADIRNP